MPNFAANLNMLFTEVPFLQRFGFAKAAGFKAVEFLFPYDYALSDLRAKLKENELKQVLFNLPAGNWASGDRGMAAHPDRIGEFRAGVAKAVEYAEGLGVTQLNCLAGKRVPQYSDTKQWTVLVENVRHAAEVLQKSGMKLLVEPINHFDVPDFFLNRADQVLKLIDAVDMTNVFVQYDIYHAWREEEDVIETLHANIGKIAHFQIADSPGRHEPGTGEINYRHLFGEMDALNYRGYVGLEYNPAIDSRLSLNWISLFGYSL